MMKKIVGLCILAFAVACGSSDTASDLTSVPSEVPGPTGPTGPAGEPGAPGAPGADGAPGSTGSTGATGSAGSAGAAGAAGADGDAGAPGAPGAPGDQGEVGEQGDVGDIACGDSLIKAAEWHTACGSSVGTCKQGQVQCRLASVEGELVPYRACYGEVKAAANSGKCHLDDDCDGAKDNTTGEGDNVTFVKQAKTLEVLISGSSSSADVVLIEGRCRNAKKHCLLPETQGAASVGANGEGVLWSDFVADAREGDLGFECADGQSIRTWECTVSGGVAAVTCTGPRGL